MFNAVNIYLTAAHPSPASQTSALAKCTGKDVQSILKVKLCLVFRVRCSVFRVSCFGFPDTELVEVPGFGLWVPELVAGYCVPAGPVRVWLRAG